MHDHLGEVDGHLLDEQVLDLLCVRQSRMLHIGDVEAVSPELLCRFTLELKLRVSCDGPIVCLLLLLSRQHLDPDDLTYVYFEEVKDGWTL